MSFLSSSIQLTSSHLDVLHVFSTRETNLVQYVCPSAQNFFLEQVKIKVDK